MEAYTNINSVEEEKLNTMRESMMPLPNQDVLNKFSEDTEGNLLYDNKALVRPYKTEKFETSLAAMQTSLGYLIGVYEELPLKNVEIKTVRVYSPTFDRWIDLRFMDAVDNQSENAPYTIDFLTLNSGIEFSFSACIAVVSFITEVSARNDIIAEILNYSINEFEIDYYTD